MRKPAVSLAMVVVLALGFGTAAVTDRADGSNLSLTQLLGVTTVINGITAVVNNVTTGADGTTTVVATGTSSDGTTIPGTTSTTKTVTVVVSKDGKVSTLPGGTTADPAPVAPVAPPVVGQSATLKPLDGTVNVKLPGRDDYEPLADAGSIPMGTAIDATDGTVRLTSAHDTDGTPQSADFHGGSFVVSGQTAGKAPVTNLKLSGGNFDAACGKAKLSFAKHPPIRQLWGSGHGNFKTSGRYSAATVRGTIWLTRDTCDGTLTIVKRGVVAVRDNVRHITVNVKAGGTYFARAPIPVSAATGLLGF